MQLVWHGTCECMSVCVCVCVHDIGGMCTLLLPLLFPLLSRSLALVLNFPFVYILRTYSLYMYRTITVVFEASECTESESVIVGFKCMYVYINGTAHHQNGERLHAAHTQTN